MTGIVLIPGVGGLDDGGSGRLRDVRQYLSTVYVFLSLAQKQNPYFRFLRPRGLTRSWAV